MAGKLFFIYLCMSVCLYLLTYQAFINCSTPVILVEMYPLQNSLLVQWLGLCAFTAEGSGQGAKKITHWKQCQTLFWGAPKSLQMVTAARKLKDTYSLEGKL